MCLKTLCLTKRLPPLTTGNVIKGNKNTSPRVKLLHANSGQEGRSGRGGSRRDAAATAKALRMKLNLNLRTLDLSEPEDGGE